MKKSKLYFSVLSAAFYALTANAQPEVTGKITVESAKFTETGTTTGAASAHNKDTFKNEVSARIYVDGQLESLNGGSTYHIELQGFNDSEAVSTHDSNDFYTQRDPLREAYIDTTLDDWLVRLGKQQVVWGTADGMKLLDMINPTDYSEMAQNQMEDSRIPVMMLNADKQTDDGGNFQFILAQPRENIFAGLDRNINVDVRNNYTMMGKALEYDTKDTSKDQGIPGHAQGNPFVLLGVDSMTGKSNGFLNIVPDIGSVATRFYNEFSKNTTYGGATLQMAQNMTVGTFAGMTAAQIAGGFSTQYTTIQAYATGALGAAYDGAQILGGFAGAYDTNLNNATSRADWGTSGTQDSAFEFMQNATFATFDAFAGAKSQWVYDMPDDGDLDVALRYKNTLENGTNYSLNYSYAYDKNPIVNLSWRNDAGDLLTTTRYHNSTYSSTTLSLADASGNAYGAFGASGVSAGSPTLRFEQTVERAHNIGGSFDTTIETESLGPVVIRGEAVYQKDVYSPVMDLTALSIGDLPAALTMVKGDRLKYVIGADITALTNMMVSVQFIQDRNLDFVDTTSTINDHTGSKYTADYATMHLTNQFNKAEENKDFVSLYLSKPFGESGQHRWNNIFIYEENGGKWNRLDVEYTVNDNTVATAEYNKYWGSAKTQFGQLEKASNVQLGLKYIF